MLNRVSLVYSCVLFAWFGKEVVVVSWHLPAGSAFTEIRSLTKRIDFSTPLFATREEQRNDEPIDADFYYNDNDGDDDEDRFPPGSAGEEVDNSRAGKLTATLKPLPSPLNGVTTVVTESDAPDRWLVPLNNTNNDFVLVDAPPYSPDLLERMTKQCDGGRIVALLVTNRNALHCDDAPRTVYRSSRSELEAWWRALGGGDDDDDEKARDFAVVAHRIDVPRDSRPYVTQILDGYGPWAWNGTAFEETGRPLTVLEWDEDRVKEFMMESDDTDTDEDAAEEEQRKLRASVREKERDRHLLAVYAPGHTMGSVCYVFPKSRTCAAGFAIPEDTDSPRLDAKGYVSTNRGTVERQVDSARRLAEDYADRFDAVLPSRGGAMLLSVNGDDEHGTRKRENLERIVKQFETVGKIYDSLGITPSK